jgi:hypothetical protein
MCNEASDVSASLLNLSALPGQAAPGQAASAALGGGQAAHGAMAGFELLMAAFFGAQGHGAVAAGQPAANGEAGAAAVAPGLLLLADPAEGDAKAGEAAKDGEGSKDGDTPKPQAVPGLEANLALIAALLAQAGQSAAQAAPAKAAGEAAQPQAQGKAAALLAAAAPLSDQAQSGIAATAAGSVANGTAAPQEALQAGAQPAGKVAMAGLLASATPAPQSGQIDAALAATAPKGDGALPTGTPQPAAPQAAAPALPTAAPQAATPLAQDAPPLPAQLLAQAEAPVSSAAVSPAPTSDKAKAGARSDHGEAVRPAGARSEALAAPLHAAGPDAPGEAPTEAPAAGQAAVDGAALEPETAQKSDAPAQPQTTTANAAPQAAPAQSHAPAIAVRGSPETVANLAAQIVKKLGGRSTRFNLELHPAELGRVDVRVEIGANGRVTAAMAFDTPQAAQELRARSADLQRALAQAGFDLSGGMSFDVAGQQNRQGQGFAETQDRGGSFRGRAFQAALVNAGEADQPAGGLSLRRGLRAGVDVRI